MRKLIQAWSSGVTFCLAGLIGEAAAGGQGLRVLRAENPLPYGQQRRELVAGSGLLLAKLEQLGPLGAWRPSLSRRRSAAIRTASSRLSFRLVPRPCARFTRFGFCW